MARELPILDVSAAAGGGCHSHGSPELRRPLTIAMGGSVDATAARNGPDRKRHPEWIKAKLPSAGSSARPRS
jgi:hypothetical protein